MSSETLIILIATISLAIVLLICGWLIRRALKKGTISYSGNRPGMPVRTYSRTESPLGFWAGIGVIVFVAIFAVLIGTAFILAAIGVEW